MNSTLKAGLQTYLPFFLPIYLLTLPFTALWQLPVFGQKLQLAEFVFLLFFIPWLFIPKQQWKPNHTLDWALLGLPIAYGMSALLHPNKGPILEMLGLVYLYGVYLLSRWSLQHIKPGYLQRSIDVLSVLLIVISLLSFSLPVLGGINYGYLAERKWIPFMGWVPRISGFTVSPNMWFYTLFFTALLQMRRGSATKGQLFQKKVLVLLLGIMVFTFSKSVVSSFGIVLLCFSTNRWLKWIGGLAIMVFLLLCHWIIIPQGQSNARANYFSTGDCRPIGKIELCTTTNIHLKRMALRAFQDSYGLGVGGGQFMEYVETQQKAGNYPPDIPAYEPHSSYFGALAETGITGVIVLVIVVVSLVRHTKAKHKHKWFLASLAFICFIGVEAWVVDVLNFRMLWLALAMFTWHSHT